METIKPVFGDLVSVDLLKNMNECLNSLIWAQFPKAQHAQVWGTWYSIVSYKNGVAKNNDVLDILGVRSGSNTVNTLKQIDMERIQKADTATLSFSKEQGKSRQHVK
jgi:hypothetical protein